MADNRTPASASASAGAPAPTEGPASAELRRFVADAQARASDPRTSAWVSANAGSGKTHVLTQRVVRLLLAGTRPSAILCLTYTKAAASEMSNRVFGLLADWALLDDATLSERIAAVEGRTPGAALVHRARRLFAEALETPGGLKIQTIHAFCEAILHQFPLEANVPGHFEILDEGAAAGLIGEARRALLSAASPEADRGLAEAFSKVLSAGGEAGLEDLLKAIVANRAAIRRFTGWAADHGGPRAVLLAACDLDPDADRTAIAATAWPIPSLPPEIVEAYAGAADGLNAKNPAELARGLRAARGESDPFMRLERLAGTLLTGKGEARKFGPYCPAGITAVLGDAQARLDAAAAHVLGVKDRLRALKMVEASAAALDLAARFEAEYERLKRERGLLDFDDIVERTGQLLTREGAGAWVHYKLDQGIDHILVDEAQDTSPAQWEVIRALADDFFAGEGARTTARTLFAVGDEKQSIYSFQGARPERFDAERVSIGRRVAAAGRPFETVPLRVSFRSTADVLSAVDHVFALPEARRGLEASGAAPVHESFRIREPGQVDVWPLVLKEPAADPDDWTVPFDALPEASPPAEVARRIAATLADWIGRETIIERGRRRPMRAGDVLVLVRKRDGFAAALGRALRKAGNIPVAGADRLVLADHIAVKDLIALGRVALQADDDLSLAALLKSPLFDLGEDDVFRLAADRSKEESLMAALAARAAAGEAPFAAIHQRLTDICARARRLSVHDFYADLLAAGGGRRRILARLGGEAGDVLDAFLAFALDVERAGGAGGLPAFLETLETVSPEIKREMEKGRDEVRIMTVHASKGLEAPVVFLVDPGSAAFHRNHLPSLRELPLDHRFGAVPPAIVWVPDVRHENALSAAVSERLKTAAEGEYRRLLYVGMTRAADRLVVCGYGGVRAGSAVTWQSLVEGGLRAASPDKVREMTFAHGGLNWDGLRFTVTPAAATDGEQAPGADGDAPRPDDRLRDQFPGCFRGRGWLADADADRVRAILKEQPSPPRRLPRPLAPSGAGAIIDGTDIAPPAASPLAGVAGAAGSAPGLERGRILHRFLQVLPGIAPDERRAAAERYLARALANADTADRAKLIDPVIAILEDPRFAAVFSAEARAEVAVMGTLKLGRTEHAVSGRIDRLAVDDRRVQIVDFKTDRNPPRDADGVLQAYCAQLAIYRAILAPLYPGRTVEAALLFTETPALIVLEAERLDRALAALTPT